MNRDLEARNLPAIQIVFDRLFNSHTTLPKLKDAVLGARFFNSNAAAEDVPGRSLVWKLFLLPDEPIENSLEAAVAVPKLKRLRQEYATSLTEKMRAPDGSYQEQFVIPGTGKSPGRTTSSSSNLEKNNPLSLHNENPWNEWFAAMELRKTIAQDVERTFPELEYFRDATVQAELSNILFLYASTHPAIGYRQGMHELLAPLYYAVDYDSIGDTGVPENPLAEFTSHLWVPADAWALFSAVMRYAGKWYEWREWNGITTDDKTPALPNHVQLNVPDGQVDLKPYVAPIVETCNRIQSNLVRSVDPILWKSMQTCGIEPQIYGIRWLRLLFTREFSMKDAMMLWDGLFACDPTLELAPWICVAMLLRIRNRMIPSDFSGQLTYLLHYPTPSQSDESASIVHHITLLLRHALALQMSPSTSTAASLVVENRNFLNISIEIPEPPTSPTRSRQRGNNVEPRHAGRADQPSHVKQQSSPNMSMSEMLARGLLDRGESLGINKTVMNAVAELKRNIPDLASTLTRGPLSPPLRQQHFSDFPLVNERPREERPPWEPRTRFEMEKDVADMQNRNKILGESVGRIVDALLLDEDSSKDDAAALEATKRRKREALESLSYVRDLLNSGTVEIDEERLLGEEEYKKRRIQARARPETPAGVVSSATLSSQGPSYPSDRGEQSQRSAASALHVSALDQAPPKPPSAISFSSNPRDRHSRSSSSFTSSPPVMTPNSTGSTQLAPWHYTRSSFSAANSSIATLPRMPPRSSANIRGPAQTDAAAPHVQSYFGAVLPQSPSAQSTQAKAPVEKRPTQKGTTQLDPLGVL